MTRAERLTDYLGERLEDAGIEDVPTIIAQILAITDARELMSLKDVAEATGCNRTTILSWVTRGTHSFPQPFTETGAGQLWDGETVRAWAAIHPEQTGTHCA